MRHSLFEQARTYGRFCSLPLPVSDTTLNPPSPAFRFAVAFALASERRARSPHHPSQQIHPYLTNPHPTNPTQNPSPISTPLRSGLISFISKNLRKITGIGDTTKRHK